MQDIEKKGSGGFSAGAFDDALYLSVWVTLSSPVVRSTV